MKKLCFFTNLRDFVYIEKSVKFLLTTHSFLCKINKWFRKVVESVIGPAGLILRSRIPDFCAALRASGICDRILVQRGSVFF